MVSTSGKAVGIALLLAVSVLGGYTYYSGTSGESVEEYLEPGLQQVLVSEEEQEGPTERRYVNEYTGRVFEPGEPPEWYPEDNLSIPEDLDKHIYEVTRYPDENPTYDDLDNAWQLYEETYDTVKENGWFDEETAVEDGYISTGRHYVNPEYYFDNETLNPEKPEFLVFYNHPQDKDRKVLAGIMYQNTKSRGEQVAGPLTVWHYHPLKTVTPAGIGGMEHLEKKVFEEVKYENREDAYERYLDGKGDAMRYISGEMIHVWFAKHPEGPFGTTMSVPPPAVANVEKMGEKEFKRYTVERFKARYTEGSKREFREYLPEEFKNETWKSYNERLREEVQRDILEDMDEEEREAVDWMNES